MASATRRTLAGSTDGRGILVVQTATLGTAIHTGPASATDPDEVWLWCVNSTTAAVKLTMEWGGVTVPNDLIEQTIPSESGLFLIAPGLPIRNSLAVTAWAATASVLVIFGYANRIVN